MLIQIHQILLKKFFHVAQFFVNMAVQKFFSMWQNTHYDAKRLGVNLLNFFIISIDYMDQISLISCSVRKNKKLAKSDMVL